MSENEKTIKQAPGNSVRITTLKGVEKVSTKDVAKTGSFEGLNGHYLKIWYKGSPQEYIVGPFATLEATQAVEDVVNP